HKPRQNAADPYLEELAEPFAVAQGTHHPQAVVHERLGRQTLEHPTDVAGQRSGLAQRVLSQVRVGFAVGGWDGRTISQGPHFRAARAVHGPIDVPSTTLCPPFTSSTGKLSTTLLGTSAATRTMLSASIVSPSASSHSPVAGERGKGEGARWTLPGSMARTRVLVRISAPRRLPSTRAP